MDKMRGLPSILSLFRNKFNKLNNTDKTDTRFFIKLILAFDTAYTHIDKI